MHGPTTIDSPQRLTVPHFLGGIDSRRAMWAVDLSVVGAGHRYTWRGWALDSGDAKRLALEDGRRTWRGFTFAVQGVFQVGV